MNAFSDPFAIGVMIFGLAMIVGYFSMKWQDKRASEANEKADTQ